MHILQLPRKITYRRVTTMAKESSALIAAKWWTDTISRPISNSFDNGDTTNDSSLMFVLFGQIRAMHNLESKDQLNDFCSLLTDRIEEELHKYPQIELDCDYSPCNILGECATKAGIDLCLFPFKRRMTVTANTVEVKDGCADQWISLL